MFVLTEKNYENFIIKNNKLSLKNLFIITLKQLEKQKKIRPNNLIYSNYLSFLLKYAVKERKDCIEFKQFCLEVVKYKDEYPKIFYGVFDYSGNVDFLRKIKTKKYLKDKKLLISTFILNINQNNQIIIDEAAKPYLDILLSTVHANNVKYLHKNDFKRLINNIILDANSITFLINMINKYPALKKSKINQYESIFQIILNCLGTRSFYIQSSKDPLKYQLEILFNIIKKETTNFNQMLEKYLFYNNEFIKNKKEVSLQILNLCKEVNCDISLSLHRLHQAQYRNILQSRNYLNIDKQKCSDIIKRNKKNKLIKSAINNLGKSLDIIFGEVYKGFNNNLNIVYNLNYKLEMIQNFVPIKFLELSIKNGNFIHLSLEKSFIIYLKNELNKKENSINDFFDFVLLNKAIAYFEAKDSIV